MCFWSDKNFIVRLFLIDFQGLTDEFSQYQRNSWTLFYLDTRAVNVHGPEPSPSGHSLRASRSSTSSFEPLLDGKSAYSEKAVNSSSVSRRKTRIKMPDAFRPRNSTVFRSKYGQWRGRDSNNASFKVGGASLYELYTLLNTCNRCYSALCVVVCLWLTFLLLPVGIEFD